MRSASLATLVAFSVLVPATAFGQFSITNYQFVSEQRVTLTSSAVTYRADLVNTGGAAAGVTATVSSLDPFTVRIIPGQETLQFAPVPANSQVTSNNTFTILVDRTQPFNFNKLSWTFVINTQPPPVANAGPNQTVPVGTTVTLDGTRSTNPSGIGTLTYSFAFTSLPPGSRTLLQRSTTPNPMFLVDVPGTYVVLLTVSNGVDSSTSSVTVSTSCTTPPVAVAGPDQTVAPGATVVLNGSASTSPCGSPLTYAYTLISRPAGSTATLTGANTVSPSFVADKPGVYKAQLIVNDGVNNSAPSIVTITQLVKPVANITAAPPVVNVGAPVQLSGAGSTDANGLPLTYQFSFLSVPAGSGATLSNPNIVNPTFTADRQGTYVVQLIVNNGTLSSDPVTIAITPSIGPAPTANAGPNQSAFVGSTVTLNGSGTDPQNLPLTYQFSLINKPPGSAAALSNPSIPNPTFVADLPGTYIAQLIVNNGVQSSAPSTVTISTTCFQPTANAGPNQNVGVGATVTLNGSGSGDVCHDPLTYAFSFTTRPPGSNATLSGANTATPTFVTDVAGMYVVQLIVNNGVTNSTPSTVTITAANDIILPAGVRVVVGQTADFPVTLTNPAGSGGVFLSLISSDPSKVAISPTSIFIPQGATAPSRVPTVTGIGNGSAIITASGTGLSSASQTVTVGNGPTINFLGSPLGLIVGASGNLTLTQSGSDPLTVTLSSSNPAAATVPATVSFGPGQSSVPVLVTSVGAGSTTINASAPGTSAAATVNVTQLTINVASASIALGQTTPLAVSLSGPAVTAVTINLASSDPTKVTVSPATVSIAAGATTPVTQPTVTGTGIGSATITGSASNYTSGSGTVTVTAPTLNFTESIFSIQQASIGNVTLNLLGGVAPPSGFTVALSSSDLTKATVPATVTFAAGAASVLVPITGVGVTTQVTITASGPNIPATNISGAITAPPPPRTISVGSTSVGQNLQAPILLAVSSAAPGGGVDLTVTSSDPSKVLLAVNPTDAGTASVVVTVAQGLALQRVYVQALASSGTATITATGLSYQSGQGSVTLTPSGFIISSPGNFMTSPGALNPTVLTLNAARLDPSLNFAEIQQVRGAFSTQVNVTSSNPAVGTASPVVFAGGVDTATSAFNPTIINSNAGTTILTAVAPLGFSTPTSGMSVTGTVGNNPPPCSPVTVGNKLQNTVSCSLQGGSPTAGLPVTLTSSDPDKLQFAALTPNATSCTGAGSGSLTLTTVAPSLGPPVIPVFCVYGLGTSGNVSYSITAPGLPPSTGSVTLGQSGVVISAPGGVGGASFVAFNADTAISVFSALLDQSGNYVAAQPIAGGSSATVDVTSSNTSIGTITISPLTIPAGSTGATTKFHLGTGVHGATNLTVSVAPGFSSPALQYTRVTANVLLSKFSAPCASPIGRDLQVTCSVSVSFQVPSALTVTVSSSNPALVALSTTATAAGSGIINITIPAGGTSATFFAQGLASAGSSNLLASSRAFGIADSDLLPVTLAPSGVVFSGLPFLFTNVGAAPTAIPVALSVLNPDGSSTSNFQPLRGGLAPVQITLSSSNPGVGIISPVTISAGNRSANAQFTPLSAGTTTIAVLPAPGFSAATTKTSFPASVSP